MMNLEEKVIDNPLFYRWVFHPDEEVDRWWENYMIDHPQEKEELLYLKKQLDQVKIVNEKLHEKEKVKLARKILQQTIQKDKIVPVNPFLRFLRYAAVAMLFFVMGGTLVLVLMFDRMSGLQIPPMEHLARIEGPTLILPEGNNVDLKEQESKLDYSQKGKIILNDQTVIDDQNEAPEKEKINQLIIPYGNRSRITLNDHTVVWLNAGSRLIYPSVFSGSKREVLLFGEAFFIVSKDESRPFIVKTSDLSIRVLGTQFNICAYPDDNVIQTVLTEGKISLRRNDADLFEDEIVVLPDQMAFFNKKTQITKIRQVDISYYTIWKDGLIKFSDEDLSRVIKQLERFYNISFGFNNPLIGSIKITGKLDLRENKEEVFKYISKVASVEIKKESEGRFRIY